MPKTNDATGATYAGHEGIVEHAGGAGSTRPGGLSQVDPSRELDGSVVEGFDSEERQLKDLKGAAPADVQTARDIREEQEEERGEETEEERQAREATAAGDDPAHRPDKTRTAEDGPDDEAASEQEKAAGKQSSAGSRGSAGSSRTGSTKR